MYRTSIVAVLVAGKEALFGILGTGACRHGNPDPGNPDTDLNRPIGQRSVLSFTPPLPSTASPSFLSTSFLACLIAVSLRPGMSLV